MKENRLDPISPPAAEEMYLDERQEDARYATLRTVEAGVDLFVEWTREEGIENMNEIRGRQLRQFRNWCKNTAEINTVSLNGIMSVLRRFLVFCVDIEAVYKGVPDKTPMPNVPGEDEVSYEKPSDEEVEAVLGFLDTHEPCSRRHVEYRLIQELGDRVGAIRAIDEYDVDIENQVIRLKHHPEPEYEDEHGTPLKNGTDGERHQNISSGLADLLERHLNSPQRHDVMDKFGRKPLLTTRNGRPEIATIRRDLYKLTRPCEYSNECPHERDFDSCDATRSRNASDCPSSHSPHPLRRWSIEHQIESGVSKELLSDRVDVSVPVLNEHYDTRTEERKREHRLEVLEKVFDEYGDPEATIDAGVLVDMFVNSDGTVDTKALMEFSKTREDSNAESSEGESSSEVRMSSDPFSDGTTGVLHPALLPAVVAFAVARLMVNRTDEELEALTSKPGTSLYPTGTRAVKGAAAYALFVALVSLNLASLGMLPSGLF